MGKGAKAKEKNSSHCVCLVIHAGNALSFACQKNAKKMTPVIQARYRCAVFCFYVFVSFYKDQVFISFLNNCLEKKQAG